MSYASEQNVSLPRISLSGYFLQVVAVPLDPVVISGDVHIGKGVPRLHVTAVECGSGLHKTASEHSRQIIEELAARPLFSSSGFGPPALFFSAFSASFFAFLSLYTPKADGT